MAPASDFTYALDPDLPVSEFRDILIRSSLAERRPANDLRRLEGMLRQSSIIFTARRSDGLIVGVSRAITDFSYCTYLSDLAVDASYQCRGIGKALINFTHQHAGLNTHLILLAAPAAKEYYAKVGFERHDSCWMIRGQN